MYLKMGKDKALIINIFCFNDLISHISSTLKRKIQYLKTQRQYLQGVPRQYPNNKDLLLQRRGFNCFQGTNNKTFDCQSLGQLNSKSEWIFFRRPR